MKNLQLLLTIILALLLPILTQVHSQQNQDLVHVQKQESESYKVKDADTVEDILNKFNLSIEEILALNNLKNEKAISPGRTLNVSLDNLINIEDILVNPLPLSEDATNTEVETLINDFRSVLASFESSSVNEEQITSGIHTGELWPSEYPLPIKNITFSTNEVKPGQSFGMTIELEESATLHAHFVGQKFLFLTEEETFRTTLLAIPLNQQAGIYPLDIEIQTGDESSQNLVLPIQISPTEFLTHDLETKNINTATLNRQLNQVEETTIYNSCTNFETERYWDSPFELPITSTITSGFALENVYSGSRIRNLHSGIDFKANKGAPVSASANGIVRLAEDFGMRGKTVVIDHGMGVCTVYTHLDGIDISENQQVTKGDRIGSVGSSGLVKLVRLHWEVRVMGIAVDPELWTQQPASP